MKGCSFKGRDVQPIICAEGWEQIWLISWWLFFFQFLWQRPQWIFLQTLIMSLFFLVCRTHPYGRYHMYLQRVDVAMSHLYLAYLLYTWDWVNYHQKTFHQLAICLSVPKINLSGSSSWSLNQHWLVRHIEPKCLLASHSDCQREAAPPCVPAHSNDESGFLSL